MQSKKTQDHGNLTTQSAAFLDMLTMRGIVEEQGINRQAFKEKRRKMIYNTLALLYHYRDII